MTGFGRAEAEQSARKVTVEIKSVNHRFLDMNIRMPRTLMFLENEVRDIIKSQISRGRLEVFINYYSLSEDDKKVIPDISFVKAYMKALQEIKASVRLKDDIKLSHIVRLPEAVKVEEVQEDENAYRQLLTSAVSGAVKALADMREKEGAALKDDMLMRLQTLKDLTQKIEAKEPVVIGEYREKLKKRLSELLTDTELDENRFKAEVVYYADRQNITEEVVRLKTHIESVHAGKAMGVELMRQLDERIVGNGKCDVDADRVQGFPRQLDLEAAEHRHVLLGQSDAGEGFVDLGVDDLD